GGMDPRSRTLAPQAAGAPQSTTTGNGLLGEIGAQSTAIKCLMFPSSCSTGTTITGIFVDGPTQGLTYMCSPSGTRGITNFAGEFTCPASDVNVDFSLAVGTSEIVL